MNKSDTIAKLAAALSKAQAEMPAAQMNATNPFLKNKYADLGSIIETAKPILAEHGLSVAQFPVGDDKIGLETVLMHESGEWLASTIYMQPQSEKGKSAAQVAGSIISYLRRYSLASVLGMYADEDTDGNQPPQKELRKTTKQPTNGSRPKHEVFDTVKNSEGVLYREIDSKTLSHMAGSILKNINSFDPDLVDEKQQSELDELQLKLDAAKFYMKASA